MINYIWFQSSSQIFLKCILFWFTLNSIDIKLKSNKFMSNLILKMDWNVVRHAWSSCDPNGRMPHQWPFPFNLKEIMDRCVYIHVSVLCPSNMGQLFIYCAGPGRGDGTILGIDALNLVAFWVECDWIDIFTTTKGVEKSEGRCRLFLDELDEMDYIIDGVWQNQSKNVHAIKSFFFWTEKGDVLGKAGRHGPAYKWRENEFRMCIYI